MNEAPSTASRPAPAKLHPLIVAAALSVIGAAALAAIALIDGRVSARHLAGAEQAVVASAPQTRPAADTPLPRAVAVPAPAPKPAAAKREAQPAPAPAAAATPATTTAAATPMPPPAAPICSDCGMVTAIREVRTQGSANGVGAIAGGVAGGVIGNQIG